MEKYYVVQRLVKISIIMLITPCLVTAQKKTPHDSDYYTTYPGTITPRIYTSKKYGIFTLPTSSNEKDIQYKRTSKMNLGVGVTYHNFSFNAAFGFFNHDSTKNNTKSSLDLQLHLYRPHWAIDALAILYKGYYPQGTSTINYYRPDARFDLFGIAAYYVPNSERFSYRAAMTQNEWQIKSAGSLLIGGEAHYGILKGDSSLIPKTSTGINKINVFSAGPGIGYAYTLVIKKHFFITGSLIANLNVNYASSTGAAYNGNKISVDPVAIYKAAIGYNSNTWSLSANLAGNALWFKESSSPEANFLATGNYRVILAKKINLRKRK